MTTMTKRFKCQKCGAEFTYPKNFWKHKKKHEWEDRLMKREQAGEVCGTCAHYIPETKKCRMWARPTMNDPKWNHVFEPDAPCFIAFNAWKKKEELI